MPPTQAPSGMQAGSIASPMKSSKSNSHWRPCKAAPAPFPLHTVLESSDMREPEAFNLGDEYQAVPIAEGWGDTDWRAGVLLSGGDARGDRPAKSLYPQIFSSEEEALNFARHEVEAQVSQLGGL